MVNPTSKVVGIDPGTEGAIVLLSPSGPPDIHMMPKTTMKVAGRNRACVDGYALADIMEGILEEAPDHIVVEKLWSRPTDTPMTAWSLSDKYSRVCQALASCGLQYTLVSPVAWKTAVIGPKENWVGNKQASVEFIQENYKDWPLTTGRQRKPHDGIADAYCLALYGRLL